jgi:hypothetical protein
MALLVEKLNPMYGLKKNEDISFLVSATLVQICIGRNDLILNFDNGAKITILSDFSVSSDGQPYTRFNDFLVGSPALLFLLSEVIAEASATSDGGLRIIFDSSARFEIFDTSNEYESFYISYKDKFIVA